jgi:L-seryl-tRNA(Ser) seleniumtransferase
MIALPLETLSARAADWAAEMCTNGISATIVPAASTVGGGSLPGETLPSRALALAPPSPDALAAALRAGDPPVLVRISEEQLILDPRTVPEEADGLLLRALVKAWSKAT